MGDRRPIGVFDSGLGGLTVLRALHARLPGEDLIYFGDTARVPYGTKGEKTVRAFARQDAGFLAGLGVKMVVVACNTASAFALDHLRDVLPVPVLGVINPGVRAALGLGRPGPVGVVGTSGTIRSNRYQEGLMAGGLDADAILARECPLFVPLVEEGLMGHVMTGMACAEYLTPLREAGVGTLILGCTHYPLLKDDIGLFMGPGTALVDSADVLAEAAAERLAELDLLSEGGGEGRLEFHLSDIPWKFAEIGEQFMGKEITDVRAVGLDEMEAAGQAVLEAADRKETT